MAGRHKPPDIDVATGGQNSAADTPVSVGGYVSASVPDPVTKDGFLEKQVNMLCAALDSISVCRCPHLPVQARGVIHSCAQVGMRRCAGLCLFLLWLPSLSPEYS